MPTTNQVSHLIAGLEHYSFGHIEVEELLVRSYKPVAARLRPADTMVGHTGYLIFARKIEAEDATNEEAQPGNNEVSPGEESPSEEVGPQD